MPGLVQRYNVSSEYAALLSTSPSPRHARSRRISDNHHWHSAHTAVTDEASAWFEAVFPPLVDVQDFLRRIQGDPDFSQTRIFAFMCPLVIFGSLFTLCVIALQPETSIHRMVTNPTSHWNEIAVGCLKLLGGFLAGLAALRTIIWSVAEVSTLIVAIEREDVPRGNTEHLPNPSVMLGGFLM